jgi:chromate transporter
MALARDSGGLPEVIAAFAKLGCVSFGGPIAHLGYFRAEFVDKRRWLDDAQYADLVALSQFLPGPSSSQVVFALGLQRAGFVGALCATACFTLPSALLMIVFALSAARMGDLHGAAWLHGLKLASVAVVAQAVWGMGKKLCPDRARVALCILASALVLLVPLAAAQVLAIALGAAFGCWLYRDLPLPVAEPAPGRRGGAVALAVWALLLAALPVLAAASGWRALAQVDSFYRAGSLVFGGGHVVLPLLRAELVPRGFIGDDAFLAGYAAAQALPGPLFTFAAYLGAVIDPHAAWSGGLRCMLALFLPGWLLIYGALPFWKKLRAQPWAQAALSGANAAVVGVLLAALYTPVFHDSVHTPRDFVVAAIGFVLLEHWRVSPGLVVLGMAGCEQLL